MSFSPRRQEALLSDPGLTIVPPGPGWLSFWLTVVALAVVLFEMVHWADRLIDDAQSARELNQSMLTLDGGSKHVLNRALMARQYHESDPNLGVMDNFTRWLPHDTDGVVEPLWPWLASRVASRDHLLQEAQVSTQDVVLVRKGKWMNVGMAALFLAGLGLVAAKILSPPAAIAILLAGAFGALLPRAVVFSPDALNYLVVILAWLCAMSLLSRNTIWRHGLFGILAGLAWLTVSTAWIVLAAWFVASGCRWLQAACRRHETAVDEAWTCRNHFIGLIALTMGWLAVCGPRCAAAIGEWGNPFHTAQQEWMWADNAEQAAKWTRDDASRRSIAIEPLKNDMPGWDRYWQSHSISEAEERLMSGLRGTWEDFLAFGDFEFRGRNISSSGQLRFRGAFLAGAAAVFITAWILVITRARAVDRDALRLPSGSGSAVIFVTAATAGYSLWYGWYRPVAHDDGNMMVLYLPLFFCFVWGSGRLMALARMRGAPRWQWIGYQTFLWVLCAAIIAAVIDSIGVAEFHL